MSDSIFYFPDSAYGYVAALRAIPHQEQTVARLEEELEWERKGLENARNRVADYEEKNPGARTMVSIAAAVTSKRVPL